MPNRKFRDGILEKTLALAFVLVGLWASSSFVASKVSVTKQFFQKDRKIASEIYTNWFKELVVDAEKPHSERDYKYEIINGQETITAPWVYDETGIYFLRALLVENEEPFAQLYTIIKSERWLFLERATRLASCGSGSKYLDITPLDRQFTCHKTEEEKCVFEHIGINFQDFKSLKEEANLDGNFEFVLFSKSPLALAKHGNKVQKSIPRNYFKDFVREIDPHRIRAVQQEAPAN